MCVNTASSLRPILDRCGATSTVPKDEVCLSGFLHCKNGQCSACAYFRLVRLYLVLLFRVYLSMVHDVLLRMLGLQGFAFCF